MRDSWLEEFWKHNSVVERWHRIEISALDLPGDLAPEVRSFIFLCRRYEIECQLWDRMTLPDGSVAISKQEVLSWFTPERGFHVFEDLRCPPPPVVSSAQIAKSLRKHLDSSPRRSDRGKT